MRKIFLIANTNFNNNKNRDKVLIENWNKVVKPQDSIYVLGNFGTGTFEELKSLFDKLTGEKSLLIGENEKNYEKDFFLQLGFKEVYENEINIDKYILTYEPRDVNPEKINIYGEDSPEDSLKDFKNKNYVCVDAERINNEPIILKEK